MNHSCCALVLVLSIYTQEYVIVGSQVPKNRLVLPYLLAEARGMGGLHAVPWTAAPRRNVGTKFSCAPRDGFIVCNTGVFWPTYFLQRVRSSNRNGLLRRSKRTYDYGVNVSRRDVDIPNLTPRENLVLRLLCQGMTMSEVAYKLRRSEKTIRNQTTSIYAKLRVNNRIELYGVALLEGAISVDKIAKRFGRRRTSRD